MKKEQFKQYFRGGLMVLFTMAVSFFAQYSGDFSYLLRTSVLGYPEHEAFDGTVYPIQQVPNWVKLSSDKWKKTFSELSESDLMAIPFYDPEKLKTSTDTLKWGNTDHDAIRNAKITYSTPYMGTYLLDGQELSGSHLAVDIKVPEGTPIYAIANGTVIKVSNITSGFGHHIVLQHNNFPTLEDKNATEVIYSSYSHMKETMVTEGTVVKKGEQIGLSGKTGTATTPHLHFQIDNSNAPWHPFWPFTWSEVSDAGLDFFSAINAGLGREKALETTINPMKYVQAYLDGGANYTPVVDNSTTTKVTDTPVSSYVPVEQEESVSVETPSEEPVAIVEEVAAPSVLTIQVEVIKRYATDQNGSFRVLLRDQYGKNFYEGLTGEMVISSVNGNFLAKESIASRSSFETDGVMKNGFKNLRPGQDRVKIEYNGETFYSEWFEIVDNRSTAFSDVDSNNQYYEAIVYLAQEGVIAGYPDGSFKPDKTVSRVEALKFIFEGIKESVSDGNLPFPDVSESEWYAKYLYTAFNRGVVNGYPDGTFKPSNTVNKAEFYKILFNGMGVDINPRVAEKPFEDVEKDDWFAPYIAYAKELGITEDVNKIRPSQGMTRGEVAYAIYRLMEVMK